MMEKFQRFGAAMLMPVMLMPFASLLIGISSILSNSDIVGSIANQSTVWYKFWQICYDGGNAIFNQLPLLFAITLPVGLVATGKAKVSMEAFMVYITYNYFISDFLRFFGKSFGVNYSAPVTTASDLTTIAGIKTFNMSILGSILIGALVAYLHNKFYEKKLPDYLASFGGAALVVIMGTAVVLPLALVTCWIWPMIQNGILGLQHFLTHSGTLGVGMFTFLVRILIPTGLHHFLWVPFDLGPAVVPGGTWAYWLNHLHQFSEATGSVKAMFPQGGFGLYGNSAVWGCSAVALAMWKTARPENRKRIAGMMIPITITAVLTGITEPVEFSFLFAAPLLFVWHALLAGLLAMTLYAFGVVGYQGGGLMDYITYNWIPMLHNHAGMVGIQLVIGVIFFFIWYFSFVWAIKKFNLPTPGREIIDQDSLVAEGATATSAKSSTAEKPTVKVESKASKKTATDSKDYVLASAIMENLGGSSNVLSAENCMTRIRVKVADPSKVADRAKFTQVGVAGLVKKGDAIQVVIGTSVESLMNEFEKQMKVQDK